MTKYDNPEYFKKWRKEHPDYFKDWIKANPDKMKEYSIRNNLKMKQYNKERYNLIKTTLFDKILNHYGRKCNCSNCPETNEKFLTIDHINGGGNEHRRRVSGQTIGVYKDIVENNFPDEYQVLCHNCNWAKGRFGTCPHNS